MTCRYYIPGEIPICERSNTDRFYIVNDCHGRELEDGVYCDRSDAFRMVMRSRLKNKDPTPIKTVDHIMGVRRTCVPEIILRKKHTEML